MILLPELRLTNFRPYSSYDLPPTTIAHPLPVLKSTVRSAKSNRPDTAHRKNPISKKAISDDTPRAFARLMNYQKTGHKTPSGLDDGAPASKKRKRNPDPSTSTQIPQVPASSLPKLLPSESLSSFSVRVDAAIPISGPAKPNRSSTAVGPRERQTKMEKRMQKMQAEWREGAAKRKEKLDEDEDEDEAADRDVHAATGGVNGNNTVANNPKPKAKSKRRKLQPATNPASAAVDSDSDPWAALAAKRIAIQKANPSSAGLVGLHDVVLAPPNLKAPREKIKSRAGGGALGIGLGKGMEKGGLKRQEELGAARTEVVDEYRRLMRGKRGEAG